MQPNKRRETLLYALVAILTLALAASAILAVSVYTRNRQRAEQTAAEARANATRGALLASLLTPTATRLELVAAPTLPPAWTLTFTPTATNTFTRTPTRTYTPTSTPTYTPTPTPTATYTPSRTPTAPPTFTPTRTPTSTPPPTPTVTPAPGAPPPVALIPTGNDNIFNILLLGSDQRKGDAGYRTDTIIVASINRTANTVSLLSIPRDLYLYIPGSGQDRVNTAAIRGDEHRFPGGGAALVSHTITYNLGIRLDRYARVNFDGFKEIIDSLGGIDVAVDCPVSDYRLAAPNLDPNNEANYKWFTLPIGYHHMDGVLALWYARTRRNGGDYDRSRRQQLVLRAAWRKADDGNFIGRLPDLWGQITKIVDTNLSLSDMLGLVPLALDLDSSRVRSYFLGPSHTTPWTTSDGAEVLLPQSDEIRELVKLVYTPPTTQRLFAEHPSLEVLNGTANTAWGKVATSRLSWEGFVPVEAGAADSTGYPNTVIFDYTGSAKPASLRTLQRVLNIRQADIHNMPDPNRKVDFKVILGASYNACTYAPWQPVTQN